MSPFGLVFPLRIEAGRESVRVVDRIGAVAAYVYICDEPERRQQTHRLSREDGIAAAQVMARALTDRAADLEAKAESRSALPPHPYNGEAPTVSRYP